MIEQQHSTLDEIKQTFSDEPFHNPIIKDPEEFFRQWNEAKKGRRPNILKKGSKTDKSFLNQYLDHGAEMVPKQEK